MPVVTESPEDGAGAAMFAGALEIAEKVRNGLPREHPDNPDSWADDDPRLPPLPEGGRRVRGKSRMFKYRDARGKFQPYIMPGSLATLLEGYGPGEIIPQWKVALAQAAEQHRLNRNKRVRRRGRVAGARVIDGKVVFVSKTEEEARQPKVKMSKAEEETWQTDTPLTHEEIIWVSHNLDRNVERLRSPSLAAWSLLKHAREARQWFFEKMLTRTLPDKSAGESKLVAETPELMDQLREFLVLGASRREAVERVMGR